MADIFAAQSDAKRRRDLLAQMMTQNQTSPIVGNTGLGQMLAKLGTSWVLKGANDDLSKREGENSREYSKQLAGELGNFMTRYHGSGETMDDQQAAALMQNDQAPTLREPRKASPVDAVVGAMASRFPELQGVGKAALPAAMKLDGSGAAKPIEVNGQLVDPTTMKVVGDFRDKDEYEIKTIQGPNGPILIRVNKRTGKPDSLEATKVSATATAHGADKGEDEFSKTLGKGRGEQFVEGEKAARTAYSTKNAVTQMRKLEAQGILSGPTANLGVIVGSFAQSIGLPVDKALLANSQAYQQQFAQQIGAYLANSSVGRTLTDKDRELLEKTMPNLIQTPEGRQQIYAMLDNAANTAIVQHQQMQGNLATNPKYKDSAGMLTVNPVDQGAAGRGTPPPIVPAQPGMPSGQTQQPIPLNEYLRLKRGGQ